MKIRLYSVFDSKTAVFDVPRASMSDAAAIRQFSDAVNDERNILWYKHPEDYSLFYMGDFDDEVGTLFKSLPVSLVTASALRAFGASKNGDIPIPFNGGQTELKLKVPD